jgi:hypothetical protein
LVSLMASSRLSADRLILCPSAASLGVFSDVFIDDMFDLVENSRSNEILSYSVIRFLVRSDYPDTFNQTRLTFSFLEVCLNEQFMLASSKQSSPLHPKSKAKAPVSSNRLLVVLMRRLHNSKTFGENLIFMLNRAGSSLIVRNVHYSR